jgi:hypothetical protein
MFDATSRYAPLEQATFTTPEGRTVRHVRRRFLPQGSALALLGQASVGAGERLDLLATRTLGDPLQFWQLADANDAMRPNDLVAEPGRLLRVPLPRPPG